MQLDQLAWLLSLPLLAIWPVTALLIRTRRHSGRQISPQNSCFHAGAMVFIAAAASWLALSASGSDPKILELLGGVAYLGAYCICITFLNWLVFVVSDTSMHVHLLVEIGRVEGLPLAELNRRYNKQAIIQARIPRLLELGQLRLRANRLVLGGRWVLAGAEAARLMRILLSIPPHPVQDVAAPPQPSVQMQKIDHDITEQSEE
jgi:hypothetical protein